jgi:hypothetical protein
MKTVVNPKGMVPTFCLCIMMFLFHSTSLKAYDGLYSKFPGMMSSVQGNSILRTNDNNGLITAGTGEDSLNPMHKQIHVLKTDDAGNVIFSRNYDLSPIHDMYCARINYNVARTGYILIGTVVDPSSNGTSYQPFVIEITELGNVVSSTVFSQIGTAFLDGTPTPQGDYVFTGFKGQSVRDLTSAQRMGIVVKTNSAYTVLWGREFGSAAAATNINYDHRWEMGEKIIAFMDNNQEKYFITGSTQRPSDARYPSTTGYNVVALSLLVAQNGAKLWDASRFDFEFGADAEYDPQTRNIYLLANRSDPAGDRISHVYRFNVATGTYNYGYWFEGISGNQPIGFHDMYSYKLKIKNGKAIVFGFLRNYFVNPGLSKHDSLYNPFRLEFEINNPANYTFTLFKKRTKGYEQTGNYNFLLGTYCSSCTYPSGALPSPQTPPQIVTQDMAVEYTKTGIDYYALASPAKAGPASFPCINIINTISGTSCDEEHPVVTFVSSNPAPAIQPLFYSAPIQNIHGATGMIGFIPRGASLSLCSSGNFDKAATITQTQVRVEEDNSVKIYPQPAQDKVIITMQGQDMMSIQVSVYNMSGIRMKDPVYQQEANTFILNVENLPSGVYNLDLSGSHFHYNSKLIIVR